MVINLFLTQPSQQPYGKPSQAPSAQPSNRPSSQPIAHPTSRPSTINMINSKDESYTGLLFQLSKSRDLSTMNLVDETGYYSIGGTSDTPYLKLLESMFSLKLAKVLTIEAWIKFREIDQFLSNKTTLFSFGTSYTYISFPGLISETVLASKKLVHLAIVFNFAKGYTKVMLP